MSLSVWITHLPSFFFLFCSHSPPSVPVSLKMSTDSIVRLRWRPWPLPPSSCWSGFSELPSRRSQRSRGPSTSSPPKVMTSWPLHTLSTAFFWVFQHAAWVVAQHAGCWIMFGGVRVRAMAVSKALTRRSQVSQSGCAGSCSIDPPPHTQTLGLHQLGCQVRGKSDCASVILIILSPDATVREHWTSLTQIWLKQIYKFKL